MDVLGASHAYKTGTANSTAATVVAAQSTGLRIRVKAFRCMAVADFNTPADIVINAAWLSDGATTPLIGLLTIGGADVTSVSTALQWDSGMIVLPGFGVAGTAATALTIDWTATAATVTYQLNVYYDVINATGDVQ